MKTKIAANPLSQNDVLEAQSLIEEMKADGRAAEIDQELKNRYHPQQQKSASPSLNTRLR